MIVKIFGEKMTFSFDYHTNKNILVEQQNVHKEMKENFDDYFPEGIQFGNKNMERYMAEEISDPEEILEFFR